MSLVGRFAAELLYSAIRRPNGDLALHSRLAQRTRSSALRRQTVALLVMVGAGTAASGVSAQGLPAYSPINPATASRSGLYFQPYQAPRPGGRWQLSIAFDYASAIEFNRPPGAELLLDTELARVGFHLTRDLSPSTFLLVDVTTQGAYGGFLDGFLDGYHGLLGIDVPERDSRPRNAFAATTTLADGSNFARAPSDAFLGDARLGIGFRYTPRLQTVLSATAPTATGPAGYGRGTLSLSALHTFRLPLKERAVYEGSIGTGYTPTHGALAAYQRELFLALSSGLRFRFWGRQSLFANVYYGSPSYHGTGLRALDRRELSFDFGWLLATSAGGEWKIGLTEDLEPAGPAIDLVFRFGARFP